LHFLQSPDEKYDFGPHVQVDLERNWLPVQTICTHDAPLFEREYPSLQTRQDVVLSAVQA
jgi:hypothetical protein